jgi:CHAD domain-containing protein
LSQGPLPLLRDRIRAFFRHLPLALAGEPEGIHQMRVAGRRVRVLVPLVAGKPEGRRVRRARRTLKALIRTAGPARDLDVCLALYDEHVALASPEAKVLRARLRAARSRSRRQMREAILDQEIPTLRRDLRALLETLEPVPTVLARIRETRDLAGDELLARLETLGEHFDTDELHDLRRGVRRLRYVAEAPDELTGAESTAPKRLKRLQEQLGGIHDPLVLAAWLARHAIAADRRQASDRAAEARRLEAAFLELARARHRAYLEADPVGAVKHALVRLGMAPAAPGPDAP